MSVTGEGLFWILRFFAGVCVFHLLNRVIRCPSVGEGTIQKGKRSFCVHFPTQKRKYAHGRIRIAKQYFLMEILGGIAFVHCGAFFGCGEFTLLSLQGGIAFSYISILTLVAWIDWNLRVIYDCFHIGILFLGVLSIPLYPGWGISERFLGMLVVSFPMLLLSLLVKGAFGGGDIKLMASSGFLLGWRSILVAMFLGLAAGSIYCIWMLFSGKLGRRDRFALGPFLALGLVIAYFYGDRLVKWYLSFCNL